MIYGKEQFLEIFDKYITRDGADKLKNYLISSDFFTAPASKRFHSAFEGGLCDHSVKTYKRLVFNIENEYGDGWESFVPHESVAIAALLHDLCKIDYYKQDFRNVKENGFYWYSDSRRKYFLQYFADSDCVDCKHTRTCGCKYKSVCFRNQ